MFLLCLVDATVNDECLEPDGLSGNPNFVIKNQLECLCVHGVKGEEVLRVMMERGYIPDKPIKTEKMH